MNDPQIRTIPGIAIHLNTVQLPVLFDISDIQKLETERFKQGLEMTYPVMCVFDRIGAVCYDYADCFHFFNEFDPNFKDNDKTN